MIEEPVAVCLAGWHRGLIGDDQGRSIRRHLVEPLRATLLLSLNYRDEDGCSSAATCGLDERLAGLKPWAGVSMARRKTAIELANELEALKHWPRLLAPLNSGDKNFCRRRRVSNSSSSSSSRSSRAGSSLATSRKQPGYASARVRDAYAAALSVTAEESPYHCRIGKGWANTFFTPVIGSPRGTALYDLADASGCLHQLRGAEAAAAAAAAAAGGRTRPFARVVFSRLAHVWLAPHPPLPLLGVAPADCVWVPHGVDGGGLSSRHAVLSRAAADVYLGRLDRIYDGRVLDEHPLGRGVVGALSYERHLAATLKHSNLSTCRFPAVAFLGCDNLTLAALTGLPKRRRFPTPRLGDPTANATLEGRNHQEMDAAIEHVMALQLPGARLQPVTRSAKEVAGGFWLLADRRGLAVAAPASHAPAFLANLTRARKLRRVVQKTSSPLILWPRAGSL